MAVMDAPSFSVSGTVEIFPMINPWIYVRVPLEISEMVEPFKNRGLVPIRIHLGSSTWKSSLLPLGDGTQFIALKAPVRKKEGIEVGDHVELEFEVDMDRA